MAACTDDDVARLFPVLLAVEADASFRCLVTQAKCSELARVLAYVARVGDARGLAQEAAQQRRAAAQAETQSLESSIGDAIRRARRIRLQFAEAPGSDERDVLGEDDSNDQQTGELASILAQAHAMRVADGQKVGRQAAEKDKREQQASPMPTRLEYPRRMKTLLEKLADYEANEQAQSFRLAFCRKMTEHLSMRESLGSSNTTITKDMQIQIGYALQVERLGLAYRRIGEYLVQKGSVDADAVRKALQVPSIASVFPVFCRLKMARARLGHLHDLTKQLAQRLPPRPSLSQAAISHRDAMLQRFRKKAPTPSEAMATASNRLLVTSARGNQTPLLQKLQLAWEEEATRPRGCSSPYTNAVNETLLSELSNLVLSTFQAAFCDGTTAPSQATIRELMGVIRVAESAVVHKGRRQRSVVQRLPIPH